MEVMINLKEEERTSQISQPLNNVSSKSFETSRTIITLNSQEFLSAQIYSNNSCDQNISIQLIYRMPKKLAVHDYHHYVECFTPLKRAYYRKVTQSEKKIQLKTAGLLPYTMIINSINEKNTEKQGDSLAISALKFMESYPFEQIQLNLEFKSLSHPSKKLHSSGWSERNQQNVVGQNNLYSNAFPSYDIISPSFEESIQCKFTLYIQSKYKILKSANSMQLSQFIDNNPIYNALFRIRPKFSQQDKYQGTGQVKLPNNSNPSDINKNEPKSSSKSQYNFNMSKYFMLFVLQLLLKEHLDQLSVTPTIQEAILKITSNIQKISKRNEDSKTNFYNHNHFNLLFLKVGPKNQLTIEQNQNLFEMHKAVFKISNFLDNYTKNSINIIKEHITRIILSQLNILEGYLTSFQIDSVDIQSDQKKDIEAKIDYFFRVKRAILQLQRGKVVNRF